MKVKVKAAQLGWFVAPVLLLSGCRTTLAGSSSPAAPATVANIGGISAVDCGCDPTPDETKGYPIRFSVVSVAADRGSVRIQHFGIPDVLPADTRDVNASAELLKVLQPGIQALGRLELRDNTWWLFGVNILGEVIRSQD